jgi:GntR family carbon starvation induced transcriptional regulator
VTGTISGWVYGQLRSDILAADLPPGGKLRIDALCARYGVLVTPMREALNQLASEGFVQRLEQRGFIVLPASAQELEQLTQTRCWVEAIALREAIAHRSAAWEAMLGECWQELSDTPRSTESGAFVENPAWEGVHRRFHMALIATCPSHWLITFCGQLSDHAMRYRGHVHRLPAPQRCGRTPGDPGCGPGGRHRRGCGAVGGPLPPDRRHRHGVGHVRRRGDCDRLNA